MNRVRPSFFLALAIWVALLVLSPTDSRASTAVAVTLDVLTQRANLVAVVVPETKRSAWEGGRIATYTRARIEQVGAVSGEAPSAPISIRTLGGVVGDIGQLVEGEAPLALGQRVVVFLARYGDAWRVVARAQGHYALARGAADTERLTRSRDVAHLVDAPGSHDARAVDVLADRPLSDALTAVADSWRRTHGS